MTEGRNREILRRRRTGETLAALARDYGISVARIRQIFEREQRKERRELELAEADRRPDQPNLLHLTPYVRAMVAKVCGKAEFTPDDVEKAGFRRLNFPCENKLWLEVVKWMALAGKKPDTPFFRLSIREWLEDDASRSEYVSPDSTNQESR